MEDFSCAASMVESFGTTADLNSLPNKMDALHIPGQVREAEAFFEFTSEHMLRSWGFLLLFTVGFLVLARIVLRKIGEEGA